jgi:tyrosyl-tRNA synthetase
MLTHSEIADNALSISSQIEKIYSNALILCKHKHFPIKIVDNLTWFKDISLINFLTSIGRQTKVKSMLSRNWYNNFLPHSKYVSVQSRLNSEDGLTFCELSYQLMQGYDYLHLHRTFGVNVQVKYFNIH